MNTLAWQQLSIGILNAVKILHMLKSKANSLNPNYIVSCAARNYYTSKLRMFSILRVIIAYIYDVRTNDLDFSMFHKNPSISIE